MADKYVRLPVRLHDRGFSKWTAEVADDANPDGWPLDAGAATQAEALRELTLLVGGAIRAACRRGAIVIGGEGDYTQHIHVILPCYDDWRVEAIRDGKKGGSTIGYHGVPLDEVIDRVRQHVGGQPAVLKL